jgi:hypothetical protein
MMVQMTMPLPTLKLDSKLMDLYDYEIIDVGNWKLDKDNDAGFAKHCTKITHRYKV